MTTATPEGAPPQQELLVMLEALSPGAVVGDAFHLALAYQVAGELSTDALRVALAQLVAVHPALRSRLAHDDSGTLVVRAVDRTEVIVHQLTAATVVEHDSDDPVDAFLTLVRGAPFEVGAPPITAHVLELEPRRHIVVVRFHHASCDGWSLGILERELAQGYVGAVRGEAPSAVGTSSAAVSDPMRMPAAEALAYWREKFANFEIPLRRTTPRSPDAADAIHVGEFTLPVAVTDALRELARSERATPSMVFASAFAWLLHRYTGTVNVLIPMLTSNREQVERWDEVGFHVDVVPLCVRIDPAASFRETLHHMRDIALEAHRMRAPVWTLIAEIPEAAEALFGSDMVLYFLNYIPAFPGVGASAVDVLAEVGLEAEWIPYMNVHEAGDLLYAAPGPDELGLTIFDNRTSAAWGRATARTPTFPIGTAEAMAVDYVNLLEAVAADSSRTADAIDAACDLGANVVRAGDRPT